MADQTFGKGKPRQSPSEISGEIGDETENSSPLIVLALGFCAAIILGLGAFYFYSGGSFTFFGDHAKDNFQSRIASRCERAWVPRAQNDRQILCALQTDLARLCIPDEKQHFITFYNQYLSDRSSYEADKQEIDYKKAIYFRNNQDEVDYASQQNFKRLKGAIEASDSGMRLPADSGADPMEALFKGLDDKVGVTAEQKKAELVEKVPKRLIIQSLHDVAAQGYLQQSDFGWFSGEMTSSAFEGVDGSHDPCKN